MSLLTVILALIICAAIEAKNISSSRPPPSLSTLNSTAVTLNATFSPSKSAKMYTATKNPKLTQVSGTVKASESAKKTMVNSIHLKTSTNDQRKSTTGTVKPTTVATKSASLTKGSNLKASLSAQSQSQSVRRPMPSKSTLANTATVTKTPKLKHTMTIKPTMQKSVTLTKKPEPSLTSVVASSTTPGVKKVDGGLSKWTEWKCRDCGKQNNKWRVRSCSNPKPSGGGANCVGHLEEKDPKTECAACSVVKSKVEGKLEMPFDEKMRDKSSEEFKAVAVPLEKSIKEKVNATNVTVLSLEPGSVVFTVEITFKIDGDVTKEPVNHTKLIEDNIIKGGRIGNFTVDPTGFTVTITVDGVDLGKWELATDMCTSMCCNDGTHVYENRTCTEKTSSCLGLIVTRLTDCKPACNNHMQCSTIGSHGVRVKHSVFLLISAILASLR